MTEIEFQIRFPRDVGAAASCHIVVITAKVHQRIFSWNSAAATLSGQNGMTELATPAPITPPAIAFRNLFVSCSVLRQRRGQIVVEPGFESAGGKTRSFAQAPMDKPH